MPVEETIWDVVVPNHVDVQQHQFPTVLAKLIAQRLPVEKKLLAVVGWSVNGGCLFQPRPGVQRYAVSYRVQCA
jgi:hypothetical protein